MLQEISLDYLGPEYAGKKLIPIDDSGESIAYVPPDRKTWRDAFSNVADDPAHYIPYVGAVSDIGHSWKQFKAARAVQGGTSTQEQEDYLNAFLADRQREQSFGYKAWNISLNSIPFMLEFIGGGKLIKWGAKGVLKGGLKAAGSMSDDAIEVLMRKVASGTAKRGALKAALKQVPDASAGMKVAAYFADDSLGAFGRAASEWSGARIAQPAYRKALESGIKGNVPEWWAKYAATSKALKHGSLGMRAHAMPALGKAAADSVLRTGLQPHRVTNTMIQNMTPQYALTQNEQGELGRVLADEGDGFLAAFAKAFGDVAIENFSEQTGESFLVLKGMFGPSAKQFLKGSIIKSYADKAIAGMVAKGVPADKAVKIATKHLLGDGARDPGLIRRMGWHGVMAEMGEEGIGGLLRQATGISKPGLPELEDVAAMAIGFALNPMAIGNFAANAGSKAYAERVSGLKTALDKAKAPDGAVRSAEDVQDLRDQLTKMAEYKQTEPQGMMQKFARAMFLDRVWDAQADLLRREGGEERLVDSDTGKAVMRRVEWEMDAILSQREKITPEDINSLMSKMLTVRVITKNEYDVYGEMLNKEGQLLNLDKEGNQIAVAIDAGDYSPYVAIDTGTLSEADSDYLHKHMPWVIQTLKVGEAQAVIKPLTTEDSFPEVTENNVISVADLFGVPSVHIERRARGASMIVKNKKQLVEEVRRNIEWKKELWRNMQKGTGMVLTPFGVVEGTLNDYLNAGQPVDASRAVDGVLRYAVGAHYLRRDRTLEFNQYSKNSDLAEDSIHDLFTEPDGTIAPEVDEIGDSIRAALPEGHPYKNDSRMNEELAAKAISIELGYGPINSGDLKNVIIDNGLSLPSEVMDWARARSAGVSTNAEGGDLLAFLSKEAKEHGAEVVRPEQEEDDKAAQKAAEEFRVQTRAHTKAEGEKAARAKKAEPTSESVDPREQELIDKYRALGEENGKAKKSERQAHTTETAARQRFGDAVADAYIEAYNKEYEKRLAEFKARKSSTPVEEPSTPPAEPAETAKPVEEPARKKVRAVDDAPRSKLDWNPLSALKADLAPPAKPTKLAEFDENSEILQLQQIRDLGRLPRSGFDLTVALRDPGKLLGDVGFGTKIQASLNDLVRTGYITVKDQIGYVTQFGYDQAKKAGDRSASVLSSVLSDSGFVFDHKGNKTEQPKTQEEPEAPAKPTEKTEIPPEGESPTLAPVSGSIFTEAEIAELNDLGIGIPIEMDDVANLDEIPDESYEDGYPDSKYSLHELDEGDVPFAISKGGRGGNASGVTGSTENAFNKMVNEFQTIRELIDGRFPDRRDVGHRALYNYANDLFQYDHPNMNAFVKLIEKKFPEKMHRMKAIYRSVTPVVYRRAVFDNKGFSFFYSNSWDFDGKKQGNVQWHYNDVTGAGRPGYLGSMHALRVLDGQGYDYELIEGLQDNRVFPHTRETSADINEDKWVEVRDSLYNQQNNMRYGPRDGVRTKEGYWYVMTKLGDKDLNFVVHMPAYRTQAEMVDIGGKYRKSYDFFDPAVAEEFFVSPEKLKEIGKVALDPANSIAVKQTAHRQFADAVNGMKLTLQLVGDVSAFKHVGDFAKRMSQAGTPGVRLEADRPIRYAIFDDDDLFDGMAFYTPEGLGQLHDDYMGTKNSQVIKLFGFFRNKGGKGSVHSYKPLAVNVEQLDAYSRYAGLAQWMKDNKIDLVIPSSSVKLGQSDAVSDPVSMTELLDTTGADPVMNTDAKAQIMEMDAQDIIISGDFNYSAQADIKTFLKQAQSILVHYNGPELQQWRDFMNQLADSRGRAAAGLSLADIIPHENPKEDDEAMFGQIQKALRMPHITEEMILAGPDSVIAYQQLTSAINDRLAEPVTRLLKSAVAPGSKSGFEDGDRKPARMAEDGVHIIPGDLDTNIEGANYTEDIAKKHLYKTKEQALDVLTTRAAELSKEYPWMYDVDPATGKIDTKNPVVRDYLLQPWTGTKKLNTLGKRRVSAKSASEYGDEYETTKVRTISFEGFTFSGEVVLTSRVPASGVAFVAPAILHRRIGDGTASLAMSDAITQFAKGEDNDADQVFIDLIPRFGNNTLQKRAHLLLLQAMSQYTPERLKYMTAEMDIDILMHTFPESNASVPINSDAGQAYIRDHTGEWNKVLGIGASTSPTLRFGNELGWVADEVVNLDITQGLVVARDAEDVLTMTAEDKLIQDHVWGNFLINFFVDSVKHGRLHDSGLNRYTTPLLYAIGAGSVHVRGEEQLIEYAGRAIAWLRETVAVQSYVELKKQGVSNVEIFGNEEMDGLIQGTEGDIESLRALIAWSGELYEVSTYFSLSSSWPGNPTGYMKGQQIADTVRENDGRIIDVDSIETSPFHYRSKLKQKILDGKWADSPFVRPAFGFKDQPPTQQGVRRVKGLVTLEAASLLQPNDYSREATAERLRAAKAEHEDNPFMQALEIPELKQTLTRFKHSEEKGTFKYSVARVSKDYRGSRGTLPRAEIAQGFADLPLSVRVDLIAMNAHTLGTPDVTSGSEWGGDYSSFIDMDAYAQLAAKMWEVGEALHDKALVTEDMQAYSHGARYNTDRNGWAEHTPAGSANVQKPAAPKVTQAQKAFELDEYADRTKAGRLIALGEAALSKGDVAAAVDYAGQAYSAMNEFDQPISGLGEDLQADLASRIEDRIDMVNSAKSGVTSRASRVVHRKIDHDAAIEESDEAPASEPEAVEPVPQAAPTGGATINANPSDRAMNFPMPAADNVTGQATTTMRMVLDGERTATTRHWKGSYKAGDRFFFEDRAGNKALIQVEGMSQKIGTQIQVRVQQGEGSVSEVTDAVLTEMAVREGWTPEAFKRHYADGKTLNKDSRQLRFHLVEQVTPPKTLARELPPSRVQQAAAEPAAPAPLFSQEQHDTATEMHDAAAIARANKKLAAARKGVRANNAKGYAKRIRYETAHLLTDAEQSSSILDDVASKIRIPKPGDSGGESDILRTLVKNGEASMPIHHRRALFDEYGISVDTVALEMGFSDSNEFMQKLMEESLLRMERWDEQEDLASRGLYFDTREELNEHRRDAAQMSYSLSFLNAASQEGWKRGNATFNTRAEVEDFAGEYDRYWKPIMLRLRDAVDTDQFIRDNFVPYPDGNYPPRMSPTPGLINKARYLAHNENIDRQTREFNEPEAQLQFGYSLSYFHPDTVQTHPQYVTAGWKLLHNEWVRVRNMMRAERLYGRLMAEKLMRLAGGAKEIGWGMRRIETGKHAGMYKLVDFDRPMENAPLGFHEDAGAMKFWDANKKVKSLNKGIKKPTTEEKRKAHQVLRAVTAVKEDPNATEYSAGLVKKVKRIKDTVYSSINMKGGTFQSGIIDTEKSKETTVEVPVRDRFYVVDLLGGTNRVVSNDHGYASEAEAHAGRVKLKGHPGRFIIKKGYRQRFRPVSEAVAVVGQERFDEMVTISRNAMRRARKTANLAAKEVLDGVDMIPDFGSKDETYMPHMYVKRELTPEEEEELEDMPDDLFEDEDTKRGKKRVYPRFIDAAALRGLEPVGEGNAATLIDNWYDDVWHRTVSRVAVTLGSTARDFDGSPMWIPRFYVNKEAKDHVSVMTRNQQGVALEHAVDYVNMLRANRSEDLFHINHKALPIDEMDRLFQESTVLLKEAGYEPVPATRTSSVAEWWVKKQDKNAEFMFSSGPRKMLEKLEGTPKSIILRGKDIGEGINRFNAWSKFGGLSLSMFHPVSLLESMIAFGGFTVKNVHKLLMPVRTFRDIQRQFKMARSNPDLGAKWAAKGMMLDVTNPNIAKVLRPNKSDTDVITRDIQAMKEITGLRHVAPYIERYHDWMNHWLWGTFYPAIKIYAAETVLVEIRENYKARGIPLDEDDLMRNISKMMNDGFGGQNWDQYIWATPRMQQLLHMTMFAPDWTLSAFNIAGASNVPGIKNVIREDQGAIQKDWAVRRYWPGMVSLVMLGIPQAVQASIYAMSRMLPGEDDPDDTPWLALNEQGKSGIGGVGGHIDLTPLLRKFGWVPLTGYEGGHTGERRVYLRFAKQATEVFEGWATRPAQTFKNKTSAAVRTAYEQITGTNTAGWEMKWGDGISGVVTGERGVVDSRAVSIIKKFVPMSLLSVLEGRPSTFFAPASRGMSLFKAQLEYSKILKAYGDRKTMDKINASEKYKVNLAALERGIIDAAQRNGITAEDVVNGAKRTVLSGYYREFFEALNKQKFKKLETIADRIVRINGSADGALRSMKHRFEGTNRKMTPELEAMTLDAFE